MTVREPITLDDIKGVITYFGFGSLATISVTSAGGWETEDARSALYYAVLDGRARIPDSLAVELDLIGPAPRIRAPGAQ